MNDFHVTNAKGGSHLPARQDADKGHPDFVVTFDGSSLYLVRPTNAEAQAHLEENVSDEAQWWAGALVVEHRYIGDLVVGLGQAGYFVRVD